MRPCHICQKIIRTQKTILCTSCKRVLCYLCISKYFPQKMDSLPKFKIAKCFVCTKQCKCLKCNSAENVVISNNSVIQPQGCSITNTLVNELQPIAQVGLFRGKKISELPLYLQRIYLKKKVLYSMHQISSLSNDKNVELQNNQQGQRQNLTEEEKAMKQVDQSVIPQQEQVKQSQVNGKNEQIQNQEDQEQQADDFESEYPSRRADHLQNNQNSAIDQQQGQNNNNEQMSEESMIDENAQDERRKRQQLVGQALEQRDDDSEEVEQINQE